MKSGIKPRPLKERFWSNVSKTGSCWLWKGGLQQQGYGTIRESRRKLWLAHRLALVLCKGPIPDGAFVCHHCDNPPCVNPAHLFVGSALDNSRDMIRKGRGRWVNLFGSKHGMSKLDEHKVKQIRKAYRFYSREFGAPALAKRFGVTKTTIKSVIKRKIWRHV